MAEEKQISRNKISTGSFDLNKWLYGGYDSDIITTVYGGAGTGKTNFCMIAAASQTKKKNKVIYIDTEGGFSIDRFKQLLGEEYNEALKNIILLKPTSFEEQWQAFGQMLKEFKSDSISLIIVDSMTMLYRLDLAECKEDKLKVKEINSKLARQAKMLSEIARKKEIPVLITNQVYNEFLTQEEREAGKIAEVRMVGGDILKYWSKCLIELQNSNNKRKAIIRKHRSLGEKELIFEINNRGIRKKGFF